MSLKICWYGRFTKPFCTVFWLKKLLCNETAIILFGKVQMGNSVGKKYTSVPHSLSAALWIIKNGKIRREEARGESLLLRTYSCLFSLKWIQLFLWKSFPGGYQVLYRSLDTWAGGQRAARSSCRAALNSRSTFTERGENAKAFNLLRQNKT